MKKTSLKIRKRIIGAALAAAALLSALVFDASASQIVCFTGVNDTLLPLREATMPAYFGTTLYVPSNVFSLAGLTVSLSSARGNLYAYRGKLRLNFFIELGAVSDQDGVVYEDVSVQRLGGLYFLPLEFVCDYFKLTYSIIPSDPASILRVKSSDAVYNDKTFAGHFKDRMDTYYSEYLAAKATAAARPTATPIPGAPTPPPTPTYEGSTVYFSFYGVSEEYTPRLLDTLKLASVNACFFISADELMASPALARRIYGEGHTVGVWLNSAGADEYARAGSRLFEAAKIKTTLISSPPEIAADAQSLAAELGLIYRPASVYADGVTPSGVIALLPEARNSVTDVRFRCDETALNTLPAALSLFGGLGFSIDAITEIARQI
jgi:hypothetical protein